MAKRKRVGIPKNKRLYSEVESMLKNQGISCVPPTSKQFIWGTSDLQFVLGGVAEIVNLMAAGHLDYAYVTLDYWNELACHHSDHLIVLEEYPCVGCCDIVFAAKAESYWTQAQIDGFDLISSLVLFHDSFSKKPNIVTRFPRITTGYLYEEESFDGRCEMELRGKVKEPKPWRYHPAIREVRGDEELYVLTGMADLAVVQVETGETLRQNGMIAIQTILHSSLMLVASDD